MVAEDLEVITLTRTRIRPDLLAGASPDRRK
jgi:hypothetical protein